jgi:polar amino acid transport system substrate-binding protein
MASKMSKLRRIGSRNRARRFPACLAAILICAFAASANATTLNELLPEQIRKSGVLTLATDAHYPPCESLADDNATAIGFEPDIWNALGARLGVRMQVISTAFGGLIPGVQSGRYAMAMECLSDSAARETQVLFIDYAYATSQIYALASNASLTSDPLSICGLKTAAQVATDSVDSLAMLSAHCLKQGRKPLAIAQFPDAPSMFTAMISGRVDFVLNDTVAAEAMREEFPVPLKTYQNALLPRLYTGMIVLPNARQLAQALLAGLRAIQQDGTYDAVMAKWKLSALILKDPGINLATSRPLPVPVP